MPALLVLAFLAVPILELYLILQVADVIGGWQTIAVLVAESVLGTWLVRREGRRTWQAFSSALERSRPPGREVADGVLVLVGGTLLLTPGFLSDIVGFVFLLPLTRPLARRLLMRVAARRAGHRLGVPLGTFGASSGSQRQGRRGASADFSNADVIDGEVLDERPADGGRDGLRPVDLGKRGPDSGTPPRP